MSNTEVPPERRAYTDAEFAAIAMKYRTWGKWGPDDDLGAANFVTEDTVRAAARLVRSGRVFSLSLPMDRTGPQTGTGPRVNPQHIMFKHGGDLLANWATASKGIQSTDDAVYLPLQASTQWDALCHVFYDGRTYNDRGPETVTGKGARHNSITAVKERAVGRGVLLDVPRFLGREWLQPGDAIQDDDLERCAHHQGVEIGRGDFVLVRTGHLAARRAALEWGDYAGGPSPGLGLSAANFFCPRGVVGVAADTWSLEVLPSEVVDLSHPLHVVLLVNAGVLIGEMWDLEALAEDCAADGIYEFFLTAQPLTITGAVGSPLNPLAIK